ncbi:MAG: hypothetical protein R3F46_06175 [bacterium]
MSARDSREERAWLQPLPDPLTHPDPRVARAFSLTVNAAERRWILAMLVWLVLPVLGNWFLMGYLLMRGQRFLAGSSGDLQHWLSSEGMDELLLHACVVIAVFHSVFFLSGLVQRVLKELWRERIRLRVIDSRPRPRSVLEILAAADFLASPELTQFLEEHPESRLDFPPDADELTQRERLLYGVSSALPDFPTPASTPFVLRPAAVNLAILLATLATAWLGARLYTAGLDYARVPLILWLACLITPLLVARLHALDLSRHLRLVTQQGLGLLFDPQLKEDYRRRLRPLGLLPEVSPASASPVPAASQGTQLLGSSKQQPLSEEVAIEPDDGYRELQDVIRMQLKTVSAPPANLPAWMWALGLIALVSGIRMFPALDSWYYEMMYFDAAELRDFAGHCQYWDHPPAMLLHPFMLGFYAALLSIPLRWLGNSQERYWRRYVAVSPELDLLLDPNPWRSVALRDFIAEESSLQYIPPRESPAYPGWLRNLRLAVARRMDHFPDEQAHPAWAGRGFYRLAALLIYIGMLLLFCWFYVLLHWPGIHWLFILPALPVGAGVLHYWFRRLELQRIWLLSCRLDQPLLQSLEARRER